jgi:hypothetical protein
MLSAPIHTLSSRSFRNGGLQELSNNEAGFIAGVFRGGWENKYAITANNSKHYNVTNEEMMFRAAKGIAGHGPDDVIKPPSCDSFISSDEMREKVLLLLFELFKGRYTFKGTALQPFMFTMFASFLRFLPDFMKEFKDHLIMKIVKVTSALHGFSFDTVLSWSDRVRSSYTVGNSPQASSNNASFANPALTSLIKQLHLKADAGEKRDDALEKRVEAIELRIQTVEQRMSAMEAKQDEQISESRKTNSLLEALLINQYNNQVLFDNLQRAIPDYQLSVRQSPDRCVRESSIVSASDDVITHSINLSFDSDSGTSSSSNNNENTTMKSFLHAFNRPAYVITATSVSIDDLIDGLFGHNWIHRCESLSSQSTSNNQMFSEQGDESDKQFLSLDRPDR